MIFDIVPDCFRTSLANTTYKISISPECKAKNIDRDINASINIRNYGIGQLDNRNTAGTVEIQACGVSSDGVVVYNTATSYDMMKQEAQSSLAVG